MLWHASPCGKAASLYTSFRPEHGKRKNITKTKNGKGKSSGAIRAKDSVEAEAWIEAAYGKSKRNITLRHGTLRNGIRRI
jgi:hypothetical protein